MNRHLLLSSPASAARREGNASGVPSLPICASMSFLAVDALLQAASAQNLSARPFPIGPSLIAVVLAARAPPPPSNSKHLARPTAAISSPADSFSSASGGTL